MAGMKNKSQVSDITIDFAGQGGAARRPEAEREFAKFYRGQPSTDLPQLVRQSRRRRTWVYVIAAFAVLAALAVAGFFIFTSSAGKFGEELVHAELQGPSGTPSGQVAEYIFSVSNDQGVALSQVEVSVRYPVGFSFASATPAPANAEGTRFTLPTIAAHGSSTVTIRGSLVGEVGEHKDITAVLTYQPESFNAQFAKTVAATTEVVASVVTLELVSPPQLPIDQPLTLAVSYKNSSAGKLAGLLLRLTSPGGFELELPKLEPLPGGTSTWKLPDLEPRADGKLELKGRFTEAAQPGAQEFRLAIGFAGSDSQDLTVQEEKVVSLTLVRSHLTLSLTANDVSLKSSVDLGQEVAYELSFVNEGELPFTDITLVAHLDPRFLDWGSLHDDAFGTVDAAAGTITWTKVNLPLLANLLAGSRGSIRFRFGVVPVAPAGVVPPLQFSAKVAAQGTQLVDGANQPTATESNEVLTKVSTQLQLSVEGRYYTDELVKLGSGPLPPKVGETTTYVVFWRLGNTVNEAERVEVTTTLPQDVTWTGQSTVSAGQHLTYNPNTREVRWELNRLPVGAGVTFPRPEASFEVAVTPSPQDADKILVLTKTTTATAHDTFTGTDLIATGKFVTTELDDDLAAQGKGVVVR